MIRPVEQLALVLPLSSWSLVPAGPERKLPYVAPHLFPESFGFDSIGKRYFWECESMIPLPSIQTVKEIIKSSSFSTT
jgi:5'-3' exonuclease